MYFNAPISYQSLDPEGDFLDVNEYWCTILGYKKEDVIGRNFSYFLVGDAKDSFKKNFNYFKNNGVIDGVEFEMRRKDGRHIFVRFSGVIEANESDDMICSHCVMSDITESIAEERFIRKELETVNKYLNLAGSFIVVIGRDQKVEFINNKGCEILQKERSKVIGTNWFDGHLVGEDVEMIKAYFNDIIAGKADLEEYFENKIITESGDHRLISWKNSVIRNNEGKIVGTISSGDDITEKYQFELKLQENQRMLKERNDEYATVNEELRQKNNEYQSLHEEYSANNDELHKLNEKLRDQYRLLKESEHLFRTVVKSSLPIIFRLDENGDFLLSEGRSLTKLGLSPGQVVGQSVYDVYKDFPEVLKAVKETYKGKETRPVVKLPGIAGDTFFDTSFSPIIDEERKIVGVVGMAVDITEERQARQKLEENEIELKKQNEEYLAVNEELKDANNRIIEINQYLEDSKKQFETIVEHMIDALFVFNEQSEIVEQNAAARKMFGIKLDESLLIGFGDLLHDDNLKFEEIMQGVRVYGKFAGEYSGKINGGKHIDLDISATSIRLRGEEHFLLIMRDISENKKKEQKILDNERKLKHQNEEYEAINEELREVNERLNKLNVVLKDKQAYIDSIITAAPAGILVEMERIIHFANDEACKITGYEASELSNMSAELLYFSKEEYIRVGKLVMKDISEVRYSRVETSWRRKDGEAVSVLLSASLIDSENPDMGVTVVVLDITAIKQYEGQLKIAKQKAEEIAIVLGGIIPQGDFADMFEAGVKAIFTPGASLHEITRSVQGLGEKKRDSEVA
ncbi:MAG: hypothetical protein C0594_02030 [Marinilabiliales bacterium]|nr:MAG: hypothetical protein C0594_02030 [Marinilabiliales bacterium]